jgi:phosphoglycerate dehydrogenase-like enzyme
MSSKLTIWSNANLSPEASELLAQGVGEHRLLTESPGSSNLAAGGHSELLQQADVAFGQPDVQQSMHIASLRWIQLNSAGYTLFDRDDLRATLRDRAAILTNSSSVYDEPCAEHVLAFMLAQARQLPQCFADRRNWNMMGHRAASRLMSDQTILILGFGAIGRRLAELLAPFNLTVIGIRQRVRGDEPIPVHPIAELDRLLPGADHVVNVLPASDATKGLISAGRLAAMKSGAIFYNIGRGVTVDQDALIQNLSSGHLGGAYLDVTTPEPLPSDHPLWNAPNCYITPHTAGGHVGEGQRLVRHFLDNLHRFENGQPLADRVM